MEDLQRLQPSAQIARDGRHDRVVHLGQPLLCDDGLGLGLQVVRRPVGVEVVEQSTGLVLLGVDAGQPHQTARVVTRVDDLGLDADRSSTDVGDDVDLVDVEPEAVEPLDALSHPPAFPDRELLLRGQLVPEVLVAGRELSGELDGVDALVQQAAGLKVHELAGDVDVRRLDVVHPLSLGELRVQFTGLGIDEVGGEGTGVPPEEGVGQRAVAPDEPDEVQPADEGDEGVEEPVDRVGPQVPGEDCPVRK